ncbi:Complement C3 [Liparis tanakae]|uniref:Complement C3 n=1 Tax=Liparis tanakae TaxID=230148 RepID=A0A4Z2G3U4_9TELE|nr:Complement C3 [Liparis tanakae]
MYLILTFLYVFSYILITGTYDVNSLNKLCTFLSQLHCRESLDLKKGKEYLIMGASKDIYIDEEKTFQYLLGEKTWIEYWPTDAEGQTDEYRVPYLEIEVMVMHYQTFGCEH